MDDELFIHCAATGCARKISILIIEQAVTAEPPQPSFSVRLAAGEWWAYRNSDGDVDRAYCPEHHDEAA